MLTKPRRAYTARDLAFVVPTKDRPQKVGNLLESLSQQTEPCGRVIVIDGGQSVRDVVMAFADRLPVEYRDCRPPGQIRQRNIGIGMIDARTPLVGCLDDDIVFEPQAVKAMAAFWNTCESETAGVSFNIVNTPPEPRSWLRDLFFLSGPGPGRVLPSGMATSNCQAQTNLRTQWLCDGATVWRHEILNRFPHREVRSRWAIGEDVIFSYPIGKQFPLYVCADARVRHEHQADYVSRMRHRFHGRTQTMWMFYFVESNQDVSRLAFLWMVLGTIVARSVMGALTLQRSHIEFGWGQIEGVAKSLTAVLRGADIVTILEELGDDGRRTLGAG